MRRILRFNESKRSFDLDMNHIIAGFIDNDRCVVTKDISYSPITYVKIVKNIY